MTGFFNVNNEQEQDQVKRLLEESLQSIIIPNKASLLFHVERKSLLVKDTKGTHQLPMHLLLPVSVPKDYLVAIMENLARKSSTSTGTNGRVLPTLRLKEIDHISLAYWDEPDATQEQQERWLTAVTGQNLFERIQQDADIYFKNVNDPNYWDVVLYRRVKKGKRVEESHGFQQVGRWRVL